MVGSLLINFIHLLDLEVRKRAWLIFPISLDTCYFTSPIYTPITDHVSFVNSSILHHNHYLNWAFYHEIPVVFSIAVEGLLDLSQL